ncbi:MAG TPA: ABC transporter ATP-binding protein [Mycobacteriales bacterium]|nr:ABC transporter ATP-binding protein [Mycobacteriales bacterium]
MSRGSTDVLVRGLRVLGIGIREQWRVFTLAVIGSALYGAMTVASAFVLGRITSQVIVPAFEDGETTAGALAGAAALILGVAILKVVGIIGRRVCAGIVQYRLQASYRRRVTRQYLRLPLSWHQQHPTGTLLSNANADVEASWYTMAPLPFACGTLIMLIITAVALIVTDPVLAIVGFVVFPAIFTVNFMYSRRMAPRMTRAQQLRAEVSEIAHESFDGALVVKTLGREDSETGRFRQRSEELRDAMIRVGRLRGLFDPIMEALPTFGTLAVLLVGGLRLQAGDTTVGALVSVAYLFSILATPIRAIGWVLGDLPRVVVGWDRVQRVLQAEGGQEYGTVRPDRTGAATLEVTGAGFAYGPQVDPEGDLSGAYAEEVRQPAPVLTDVSFDVAAGRTVALVGPTGSGKSTLVSLLVRLVDPDTGAVLLDRDDLRELAHGGVAEQAALVSQSTFLFDDSVRDNVTLGADVDDEQVRAALRLAQADRFVDALPHGLDTRIGERGTTLSGGQRQRLALARALVRHPRLLVLDDATSSVDPAVEAAILHGLRSAELGATVVVVAYRRATIALADEVVWIERGRVVDRGPHEELIGRTRGYALLVNAYDDEAERRAGLVAAEEPAR